MDDLLRNIYIFKNNSLKEQFKVLNKKRGV